MKSKTVEQQYRLFLLALSGGIFIGTNIELWLIGHMESIVQLMPFALSGVGLSILIVAFYFPQKRILLLLRIIMAIIAVGGLYGIFEHVAHNLAFELEIRPNATMSEAFRKALSGASPLLAPGILSLAATLALAAVYRHPVLVSGETNPSDHLK